MNNPFIPIYKDYSNVDLLKIIEQAGDYQAAAVEAAKTVLAERKLSGAEMLDALVEIEDTVKPKSKIELLLNKDSSPGSIESLSIGERLYAQQRLYTEQFRQLTQADKIARIISFITIVLFVWDTRGFLSFFFVKPVFIRYYLELLSANFFLTTFIFTTIYLLWTRRRLGWIMLVCLLIHYSEHSLMAMISNHYTEKASNTLPLRYYGFSPVGINSGIRILLSATFLFYIIKNRIRHIYNINSAISILVLGLLTGIYSYLVYTNTDKLKKDLEPKSYKSELPYDGQFLD